MITDSPDVQTTLAQALQEFAPNMPELPSEIRPLRYGLAEFYLRPNHRWLAPGLDEKC